MVFVLIWMPMRGYPAGRLGVLVSIAEVGIGKQSFIGRLLDAEPE
jgi:uncharacterized protein (DUF3820 family)